MRTNDTKSSTSSAKFRLSISGYMSTRLPVSSGWSVQRPNVGIGTARLSRTSRWSIQVISSVEPLPIATVLGWSPSVEQSSSVIVPASLG